MSPSRKAKLFDPIPSRGFQDILKRRLLTLCSDESKSRKFPLVSELSNGRCPTGYRLSILCLLVRLLHIHICAHAYLDYVARRMFIFGVGFALSVLRYKAMRQPLRVELAKASFTTICHTDVSLYNSLTDSKL